MSPTVCLGSSLHLPATDWQCEKSRQAQTQSTLISPNSELHPSLLQINIGSSKGSAVYDQTLFRDCRGSSLILQLCVIREHIVRTVHEIVYICHDISNFASIGYASLIISYLL